MLEFSARKVGPKGVDLGQRAGEGLRLELAADREVGRAREEILGVVDLAVGPRRILQIERRDPEQFAGALAIAAGDDRRVHVNKAALLEKLVDGESESAADAKDAAEQIRARAKMGDLAQEFRRVPLLLQRVAVIRWADDLDGIGDHFPALAFALGGDELPLRAD